MNYNSVKIGDEVILTSDRPNHWNPEGAMDRYLGQHVIITNLFYKFEDEPLCIDFKENNGWTFRASDIDKIKNKKRKLWRKNIERCLVGMN